MKILILGSEGFIGKHCVQYFLKKGYLVSGADLLDLKETNYNYIKISRLFPAFDFFKNESFDACINAAGSGSVPLSFERPENDFEANTFDVFNLLESIRLLNPACKYLNISSAAVYGNSIALPISEKSPVSPLSPYGWHKYYSELICKEYAGLYQINTCSIRPFSVYGPGLKKQLFWDIYKKSLLSKQIELFGSGGETRDFIFIDDLVDAIDCVLSASEMRGEVINVASGVEVSISEAATIFCKLLDPAIELSFTSIEKKGDPLNWRADITYLESLRFSAKHNISKGLSKTVAWIKEKI